MQSGMPYAYSVAKQYGYATDYTATTHPSLPNYIAIASGQTFGIADDAAPSSHRLAGQTVFGQALEKGKTAKTYADGMQSDCALVAGGDRYAVKHNPWAYFVDPKERAGCNAYDVPESRLQADITAGALPTVGMVVPNLCNDAHDCTLATADNWFKARIQAIMAGPDWKSGHLAVVLTADEDDRNSGNKVLTVVMHPSLHGKVVSTPLTHYSYSAFLSRMSGSQPLAHAATAPSFAAAFGLAVAP
jgi:phospholipase C